MTEGSMTVTGIVLLSLFVFVVICLICVLIRKALRSPFRYPYYSHTFDITGKRNPKLEELVDQYLLERFELIEKCHERTREWKRSCRVKIDESICKKLREKQYLRALDDENAFCFKVVRTRTRYKQKNEEKSSDKAEPVFDTFHCGFKWLETRKRQLEGEDFVASLSDYQNRRQRIMLKKALKSSIVIRDHYTCRACGKYMPDCVGLRIDHIRPISEGGLTTSSNLQVLCSECLEKKENILAKHTHSSVKNERSAL